MIGDAVARTWTVRPSDTVTAIGTSIASSPASARDGGSSSGVKSVPSGWRLPKIAMISVAERPASGWPARASARSFAAEIRPSGAVEKRGLPDGGKDER